jgi:methyl-accepting chemotaxis protein
MFDHLRLRTKLALLLGLPALAVIASIASGAMAIHDRLIQDRVDKLRAVIQSTAGVAHSVEAQVTAATGVLQAANALGQQTGVLRQAVDGFLATVRAV